MTDKEIVFITGANTGIGYEAVKMLLESPKAYHILLGSRSEAKGKDAVAEVTKEFPNTKSVVEFVPVDVTDDASIENVLEIIRSKYGRLDVLVNNAGAQFESTLDQNVSGMRQAFNDTWNVNVTGAQVLTHHSVPLLLASSSPRLIFLTSGLSPLSVAAQRWHPFAPNPPAGWPKTNLTAHQAYRSCKTGLNMLMLTWHWLLKENGVKTWAISPGFLATRLGGDQEKLKQLGAGEPWLGGDLIKRVIEGERDADVGKVVAQNGKVQEW